MTPLDPSFLELTLPHSAQGGSSLSRLALTCGRQCPTCQVALKSTCRASMITRTHPFQPPAVRSPAIVVLNMKSPSRKQFSSFTSPSSSTDLGKPSGQSWPRSSSPWSFPDSHRHLFRLPSFTSVHLGFTCFSLRSCGRNHFPTALSTSLPQSPGVTGAQIHRNR
jgi:hypothetical protein